MQIPMKIGPGGTLLLVGVLFTSTALAQGQGAAATPAEILEEVRMEQAASAGLNPASPTFVPVPAPSAATLGAMNAAEHPARRTPTFRDKERLEAQLRVVDSALKIHEVTDRNTQRASEAIASRGEMLFTYAPGGIYEVQTAIFHETAFELQPGEVLTGKDLPTAGDTARWTIAVTRSGTAPNEITVLLVKPLDADLETNMTITTNRRLYTVILRSNEHTYMPLVGWLYPQEEARALEAKAASAREHEAEAEPLTVAPEALNFNCSVSGAQVPWRPIRVYDDGAKTYLQMSPAMQAGDAPALFVLEDKAPILVNFRVKHAIYIVDRLFDRAQLRVGPKTVVEVRCAHHLANR